MGRLSMAEELVKEGSIIIGSRVSNSTFCEFRQIILNFTGSFCVR
ncbi:MAG: hypothetical protein QNJ34_28625 [Xenococcaceae cyanobacterium MO_188.B29]|nr:hypothetical protein [Xenococcaceae cyanobacterium MO_188.B29]